MLCKKLGGEEELLKSIEVDTNIHNCYLLVILIWSICYSVTNCCIIYSLTIIMFYIGRQNVENK